MNPIERALANADKIIAANADLERITLAAAVERAIAAENANPKGLPEADLGGAVYVGPSAP